MGLAIFGRSAAFFPAPKTNKNNEKETIAVAPRARAGLRNGTVFFIFRYDTGTWYDRSLTLDPDRGPQEGVTVVASLERWGRSTPIHVCGAMLRTTFICLCVYDRPTYRYDGGLLSELSCR